MTSKLHGVMGFNTKFDAREVFCNAIASNFYMKRIWHVSPYIINLKQETAEDSKAPLSEFDLENQSYQEKGTHTRN